MSNPSPIKDQQWSTIGEEVRAISSGTSDKFVPMAQGEKVLEDILVCLRRFNYSVRMENCKVTGELERIMKKAEKKRKKMIGDGDEAGAVATRSRSKSPTSVTDPIFFGEDDDDDFRKEDIGLGSGVRPNEYNGMAPKADKATEAFLQEVEKTLITMAKEMVEEDNRKKNGGATTTTNNRRSEKKERQRKAVSNRKSNEVNDLLKKLAKQKRLVAVPTDKTNSHVTMDLEMYCKTMMEELKKDAVVVNKDKLGAVFVRAKNLLAEVDEIISTDERAAINESIKSAAVPTPILLVKDHKKKDKNDAYPVRLICPATNFVAVYDKIGHKAIQNVLDKLGVVYGTNTIVQASDLKEELEKMGIVKDEKTIISFDAVKMYPSITLSMVRRAVTYFCRKGNIKKEDQKIVDTGLKMVEFAMSNTFLTFRGQYYEYGGDLNSEERGLTIGGYGSAFFADLVAAFALERAKELNPRLFSMADYLGIYRDDGIMVVRSSWDKAAVKSWRDDFQRTIDDALGSDRLQFTAVVWGAEKEDGTRYEDVTVHTEKNFPFLDMELEWKDHRGRFSN